MAARGWGHPTKPSARKKGFEEGDDVHGVGPEILQGYARLHGVAAEKMLDRVPLKATFRAKRRVGAAHFGKVIVKLLALSRTKLGEGC